MATRLQDRYWAELVQLKVSCEYVRRYRDNLTRWMTGFAITRAVVSSSAVGGWAVVQSYPMIWGDIIALAQVADAVQNTVAFAARLRGTSALVVSLDALLIECEK